MTKIINFNNKKIKYTINNLNLKIIQNFNKKDIINAKINK